MKSIGIMDKVEGKIRIYHSTDKTSLFRQKRHERIAEAMEDIRYMGNINIYLINGNKYRLIQSKGM